MQTEGLEAKRLLEHHFGDEFKITNAYMEKALNWNNIPIDNGEALHSYALFLRGCCNVMRTLRNMDELNLPSNMRLLISKVPYKVKEKWRSHAFDIKDAECSTAGNTMQLFKSSDLSKLCPICSGNHGIVSCQELLTKPHNARVELLKTKGVCFGCLVKGHMSRTCQNRQTCSLCSKQHPTILHIPLNESKDQTDSGSSSSNLGKAVSSGLVSLKTEAIGCSDKQCTLAIIPVQVKLTNSNHIVQTYAFLDPGSSATFCTDQLRKDLNAKGKHQQILLRTMGQTKPINTLLVKDLEVCSLDGKEFIKLPDVYTQKEIPVDKEHIPKQKDIRKWPYLQDVDMPTINAEVGLLIGINVPKLMEPWRIINSQGNDPFAIKTLLGWIVNGPFHGEDTWINKREKYAEERKEMSLEDCRFMQVMDSSAEMVNGRYQLPLPFKRDNPMMPNNLHLAEKRILSLKRKFQRNSDFHKEYSAFMETVISSGHAELVPQDQLKQENGKVWYIPHHGVFHPKKGSLRVVFDCSAAYQGVSLNTELIPGPNLTNTLIGVLVRFRLGKIAIMTDVEKMFHQVKVSPHHVNFLRFLWWPDGNVNQPLKEYRMVVHLFGATSSSSCASYALKRTAEDNTGCFSAEATNTVKNNFYVDDLLKAVDTENHAIRLCKELKSLCASGGFKLTKWISNNRAVLASIPESERAMVIKNLDLETDNFPLERALGVQWSAEEDAFMFKVTTNERPCSRRGILSMVSSIYDPLGFLAPLTFPAKRILQELCRQNIRWDDELPEVYAQTWKQWWQDLPKVREFKVNRYLVPKDYENPTMAQMHHFCDASDIGYGTVSYLRLNSSNKVHVTFIMGKARVAPLKVMTTPQMELTAAVLAVRMDKILSEELHMELAPSLFWTDSMTILRYIHNENRRFQTFVANLINIIRSASKVSQWRYIGTKLNPADYASRGLTVNTFLKRKTWIDGPDFLREPPHCWSNLPSKLILFPVDPELRKEMVTMNVAMKDNFDATTCLMNYFSTWMRLKRAVAWLLRFKSILSELHKKRKVKAEQSRHTMTTRKGKQENPDCAISSRYGGC